MFEFLFKRKSEKPNLYLKCNELPIHNFNEVSNGDFNYLKKDKDQFVEPKILQETWLDILSEYLTISKNYTVLNSINRKLEISILESRLNVFLALKKCIQYEINVTEHLLKRKATKENIQIHINLLNDQIATLVALLPTPQENKPNDNFEQSIASLIRNGCQINRFKTVVTEWVALLNQIKEQAKANKKNG